MLPECGDRRHHGWSKGHAIASPKKVRLVAVDAPHRDSQSVYTDDVERSAIDQQSGVRDPLAAVDAVLAARRRPMSERLELALSWNALAAQLRAGLLAAGTGSKSER
jgi:hypothetical protein